MKQERTKDWVRLLPWAVLTMNSQEISSTGYTPRELFYWWRPACFFKTPFPEDYKSPVGVGWSIGRTRLTWLELT